MKSHRHIALLRVVLLLAALSISLVAHAATDPSTKLSLHRAKENVVLSWFGAPGVPYQLESSSNAINWVSSGAVITGSNALSFVTNSVIGQTQGFYRVSRLFPSATNSADFNPATGLLTVVGDDFDNLISIARSGNDIVVLTNGVVQPITGGTPTISNTFLIQALGLDGNDQISIANGLPSAHLFGGLGNDILLGGSSVDTLFGGPGNDILDGNQNNDFAYLGEGDDTFVWDPGDGSDVVEGQEGNDNLLFNGANIGENIDLSAQGSRFRFFRSVASITLDTDGIELVNYRAFGGADNIVINNLAGTVVTQVDVTLSLVAGTGDAAADNVVINGTSGPDVFNVSTNNGAIEVTGLSTLVRVLNGETNFDNITINGSAGDIVNINGSTNADIITLVPSLTPGYAQVFVEGFSTGVNVSTNVALLALNGLEGPDRLTAIGNIAGLNLPIKYDGGEGDDTILGGNANELLVGGPGKDFLDGNQGNDTILGGDDDDAIQWDPGDGSDTIEGQGGSDKLVFNGSNIGENFDFTNIGSRLQFTRNIASITISADGIEQVDLRALGGLDNITINNLTSTSVNQINLDLTASLGGGDAQSDVVTINGTPGVDTINVTTNSAAMEITGLSATVRIVGAEFSSDHLTINGNGGDTVNVNGSEVADTMSFMLSPFVNYLRVHSSGLNMPVDVGGALTLAINGLGGSDVITGNGDIASLGIPVQLDGGEGDDFIAGSNAAETILGGPGKDIIDGNGGNDTIYMGDDDDTFVWDSGDGSDIVEGQGGNDKLIVNGTNSNEFFDLSAVATRLLLSRRIGNVTLDVDGVERIDLQPLGGVDNISVNSLAGTAVQNLNIDLTGVFDGTTGDAQPDTITVFGSDIADAFNVTTTNGAIDVSGITPLLHITHSELANDALILHGLGGTDTFTVGAGVTNLITVITSQN